MREMNLEHAMKNAVHIVWGTGGSMVPADVMKTYYETGCIPKIEENGHGAAGSVPLD